ncbi:RNase H family protein [uncultured Kocuria sp.]|uniref:RNase H family protein n=1 Tax=uncultured Kocuria sp. TaxID=259305 RepID=UPI002604329D|nr:RNase H family protein [uncultured Kocuria sp.]
MTITAAADGSALGNPGPAGWAWYIDDNTWRAGGWPHGTNNMGELKAVLDLLEATAHRPDESLRVLCDSQYVINSITKWMPGWKKKGWKKKDGKPVLNVELMKALDAAMAGRDVHFEWVKGHAGHELNEAADSRARAVATAFQTGRPAPEGPGFDGAARRPDATSPRPPAPRPVEGPADGAVEAHDPDALEDRHDPDLLSELLAHEEELARGRTAGETVQALERDLLRPEVRADPGRLGQLLHEGFAEVGASGSWRSRQDVLDRLPREPSPGAVDVHVLTTTELGPAAVHLVYRLTAGDRTSLRSSLWVREDSRNELGPWQLRFHQGTYES